MNLKTTAARSLLLIAPIVLAPTIFARAAEAAGFAQSTATLEISGLTTDATVKTEDKITNVAEGTSDRYFAFAAGLPQQEISLSPTNSFSFDFTASIDLTSRVDNPQAEDTRALAFSTFGVFNTQTQELLDSFSIFGVLNTVGNDSLRSPSASSNVTIASTSGGSNFGATQTNESASRTVRGSYSRSFDRPISLTLVTQAFAQSCAQAPRTGDPCTRVPEPATTLGAFSFAGFVAARLKARRKRSKKH